MTRRRGNLYHYILGVFTGCAGYALFSWTQWLSSLQESLAIFYQHERLMSDEFTQFSMNELVVFELIVLLAVTVGFVVFDGIRRIVVGFTSLILLATLSPVLSVWEFYWAPFILICSLISSIITVSLCELLFRNGLRTKRSSEIENVIPPKLTKPAPKQMPFTHP